MADFPNIAATTFPGVAGTTLDQNAFVAPGQPVVGTVQAPGGPSWGNLSAEQLASVIAYQNARLSSLEIPTMQGNLDIQRQQLGQNADQFAKQLFFNEEAQRASELQAYRSLQAQTEAAEKARATQQMLGNFGAATQALTAADQMAQARQALSASSYGQAAQLGLAGRAQAAGAYGQAGALEGAGLDRALGGYGQAAAANLGLRNLSASSYGQAESLRQGLIDKALQTANLIASLRGPSNAFKQLEVNGYLGGSGAGSLIGALAGGAGVPAYRGMGGTPEAATLGTMARDAGSPIPGGGGDAFADSAGIQGLLGLGAGAASGESPDVAAMRAAASRAMQPSPDVAALRGLGAAQATGETADQAGLRALAAQNASPVPSYQGKPLDQFANLMEIARANTDAGHHILDPNGGPGSDFGNRVIRAYNEALAASGESYLGADDPRLIAMYRAEAGPQLSEMGARQLTHFAQDYYGTYGQPMIPGMLNETLGQILAGQQPDATKWSEVNRKLIPGYGTPGFKPPPQPWSPGAAPPVDGAPAPGTPGTPPGVNPGGGGIPPGPPTPSGPGLVDDAPRPIAPQVPNPVPAPIPPGHGTGSARYVDPATGYVGDPTTGSWYDPTSGLTWWPGANGTGQWSATAHGGPTSGVAPLRTGDRQAAQVMPGQFALQTTPAPSVFTAPSPGMVAPPSAGPGGTTVLHPATAGGPAVSAGVSNTTGQQAGTPGATYTFTAALPGGKGRGFIGSDGKIFDEGWNPVTW